MTDKNTRRFVIGIEIYETSRTIRRHFDKRARTLGFTQGQWRALWKLDGNPGISQVGLADLLDMQPISLQRVLDRMETAGLIERKPDPTDRRAVKLFLTPQAGPILKVLHEMAEEVRVIATKGLSEAAQAQIIASLQHMRANFEAFDNDASALPDKVFQI